MLDSDKGSSEPVGDLHLASGTDASSDSLLDRRLWARLREAAEVEAYAAAWLALQCRMIDGVCQGVVVLGTPDRGPFIPVANWPQEMHGSPGLSAATELALADRRVTTKRRKFASASRKKMLDTVACPLLVDDQLCGAAAIEIDHCSEAELRNIIHQLEWGCAGLEALVRRKNFTSRDRLVTVLELVATSLHHHRFQAAATSVVTELARALQCERVSVGFLSGKHTKVRALSHSAAFGKKSNLIRAIEAAMDEAIEQQATLVYPPPVGGPCQVTRAQADLAGKHGAGTVCTVPLTEDTRVLGALTLERPSSDPFAPREIELCEHAASLLGPVLDVKRREDRWLIQKAVASVQTHLRNLVGPRHVALKLSVFAAVVLVGYLALADGDYRITADAALEGTVQRVIAAPMAGYVAQATARAGDIVREGAVLGSLDDRDMRLERLKWASQRAQRLREYSEALAAHDRAQVRILAAQIEQTEAQIALLDEQLARTRIVAPFDGIVVAGDLSQSLGAPVERGDVLYEVAPLDEYRIILNVDERDIGAVAVGQRGYLALTGMPRDRLPMVVEKIVPVSAATEGRNYFRVEARLEGSSETLRPGMEGVGKIEVERRKLIWIWTYKLVHWLRMFVWTWWP